MKFPGHSVHVIAALAGGLFHVLSAVPVAAAIPCASLAGTTLPNTIITLAENVAAGKFTPPTTQRAVAPAAPGRRGGGQDGAPAAGPARGGRGGNPYANVPEFCRVVATLKPSGDSDIKIEVWLPVSGWNNKLLAVGNGGWAGTITYNALVTAVVGGYVGVSTDTGHTGSNAENFVLDHPEKVLDFAYRAVHEMTVSAKALADKFYGAAPQFSYFQGCSTGGRQALTEAQRYPLDFDGIIAGANAMNSEYLHATQIWVTQQAQRSEASVIPQAKYALLHEAALKACDAKDGVVDRLIENPRQCKFDPAVLICKPGDNGDSCLTADQVETAKRVYAGPGVWPGYEVGSEAQWNSLLTRPVGIAYDMYRLLLFKDPRWDFKTLDVKKDIPAFQKTANATWGTDANLKPFFDHGGKLLMYHGWADAGIPSGNSINYYNDVLKKVGTAQAGNSIRLFMVPGMGHCGGGDGPNQFDTLSSLDRWVQTGKPPQQIIASRPASLGAEPMTRPLCPYPQIASYRGSGSTNDAANFACKAP